MKKLLFLLLIISGAAKAQITQPYRVQTIAKMKTYAGTSTMIYVAGSVNQIYDTCTYCTANGTTIHAGVAGRKWKVLTDSVGTAATLIDYVTKTKHTADSTAHVVAIALKESIIYRHSKAFATGNGVTDDAAGLIAWLNSGSNLYLDSGTYSIGSQLLSTAVRNGLTIVGNKAAKIVCTSGFTASTSLFRIEHVKYLTIKDLVIEQNGTLNDTNKLATIGNGTQASIRLEKDSTVLIDNCTFLKVAKSAMYIDSCANVIVQNCTVPNTYGYGFGAFYCSDVTFDNNKMNGIVGETVYNYPNGNSGIGILGGWNNRITISKNYIDNFVNTGTKTEGCTYVFFHNNVVKNSGKDGIKVQASPDFGIDSVAYAEVTGNEVDYLRPLANDGNSLIQLWDTKKFVVANNICHGGTRGIADGGYEVGIKVFAASGGFITRKGIIANNTIDSVGGEGIYILNADNINISNNNITSYALSSTSVHAIWLNVANNISISHNRITQPTRPASGNSDGVYVQLSYNVSVTNNTIVNPAFEGVRVQLSTGNFIDVSNNNIYNASERSINIFGETGAAEKVVKVDGNIIYNVDGSGSGIHIECSDITITDLTIRNNTYYSAIARSMFTTTGTGTITKFVKGNNSISGSATEATYSMTPTAIIDNEKLTGYVSGAGTVATTDTYLQAIQKLNGNVALKAPLISPTFTTPDLGVPSAVTLTNGTGLPESGVTNLTTDLSIANATNFTVPAVQAMGSVIKALTVGLTYYVATFAYSLISQDIEFTAVYLPSAQTLTGVKWLQATNGSYTASNYNGVGLYTVSSGTLTLVASSTNDGTIFQSGTGLRTKAFSGTYAAAAGLYYVGMMHSRSATTTIPQIRKYSLTTGVYSLDFTNSLTIDGTLSTQTALPSPQVASGFVTNDPSWIAVY